MGVIVEFIIIILPVSAKGWKHIPIKLITIAI